ncbi:hypothetical protein HDU76_003455, partial [Blyttiomyces sp. JEL0837]
QTTLQDQDENNIDAEFYNAYPDTNTNPLQASSSSTNPPQRNPPPYSPSRPPPSYWGEFQKQVEGEEVDLSCSYASQRDRDRQHRRGRETRETQRTHIAADGGFGIDDSVDGQTVNGSGRGLSNSAETIPPSELMHDPVLSSMVFDWDGRPIERPVSVWERIVKVWRKLFCLSGGVGDRMEKVCGFLVSLDLVLSTLLLISTFSLIINTSGSTMILIVPIIYLTISIVGRIGYHKKKFHLMKLYNFFYMTRIGLDIVSLFRRGLGFGNGYYGNNDSDDHFGKSGAMSGSGNGFMAGIDTAYWQIEMIRSPIAFGSAGVGLFLQSLFLCAGGSNGGNNNGGNHSGGNSTVISLDQVTSSGATSCLSANVVFPVFIIMTIPHITILILLFNYTQRIMQQQITETERELALATGNTIDTQPVPVMIQQNQQRRYLIATPSTRNPSNGNIMSSMFVATVAEPEPSHVRISDVLFPRNGRDGVRR